VYQALQLNNQAQATDQLNQLLNCNQFTRSNHPASTYLTPNDSRYSAAPPPGWWSYGFSSSVHFHEYNTYGHDVFAAHIHPSNPAHGVLAELFFAAFHEYFSTLNLSNNNLAHISLIWQQLPAFGPPEPLLLRPHSIFPDNSAAGTRKRVTSHLVFFPENGASPRTVTVSDVFHSHNGVASPNNGRLNIPSLNQQGTFCNIVEAGIMLSLTEIDSRVYLGVNILDRYIVGSGDPIDFRANESVMKNFLAFKEAKGIAGNPVERMSWFRNI
jgi:hypothetical protein